MSAALLALPLGAALLAALAARRFITEHGPGRIVLRFVLGLPLDGIPRTDAGWLRRGSKVLHRSGHASRWAHLPHIHRAGARLGLSAALAGLLALWRTLGPAMVWVGLALALLALLALAALTVRAGRIRQHHRRYVRPLHRALAPAAGVPLATRPADWLDVPRDFATADEPVITIALPEGFAGGAEVKRHIERTVTDRLGLGDPVPSWRLAGSAPRLVITTSAPPPARVGWPDIREHVERARPDEVVLGLGRKRQVITAELDADSPHILISAGTGGGKSALARTVLAQGLHRGDVAIILDVKRTSHRWTKGLPSVAYVRDVPAIHAALCALAPELDRRNQLVDALSDENGDLPESVDIGPRIWVVAEEVNALAGRLATHWKAVKAKEDPPMSPAVAALGECLFMGREPKVNVIGIGQMVTARTLGGPEARENFAYRCLTRYSANAWKMLAPEVPMPPKSRHPGRWQMVTGGAARETQVAFLTSAEARQWALSGDRGRFPAALLAALTDSPPGLATEPGESPSQGSGGPGAIATAEPEPELTGLAEACSTGLLSLSLAAVRSARARDPEFPAPAGRAGAELLYPVRALVAWERNRELAGAER